MICCLLWLGTAQCDSREPTGAAESYPLVNVGGIIEPYSSENTFNASSLSLFEGASRSMECRNVVHLNGSQWCSFVKATEDCRIGSGFIDYLQGAVCGFCHDLLPLAIVLYAVWLIYLFMFLGITAEKFFCPNLAAIATSLKLSHNVAVSLSLPLVTELLIYSVQWLPFLMLEQQAWRLELCLVLVYL